MGRARLWRGGRAASRLTCGRMPFLRRLTVLALALVAAGALAQSKPKKKAKRAPPPPPAQVTKVEVALLLDGVQDRVANCVLEDAGDGPVNQQVVVGVTLNGVGQLMASEVKLVPENAQAAKTRGCIEGVVKGIEFPKTGAPLVTAEREWTFKTE